MPDASRLGLTPARKAWCRQFARTLLAAVLFSAIASTMLNAPLLLRALRYLITLLLGGF